MKSVRQLAAIMFTDMVGYTALMQKDETKAKRNRDRHRLVLEETIAGNNGKILQYYGDGTLCVFNSVIDAVTAAMDIQQQLQKDPAIPLRVGIHSGDIVYDDDGVYGDGVNIASRVESLAVTGAVLFSGKVFDEIKNHPQFKARAMGSFNFKNVKRPLRIYALANDGIIVPLPGALKGKTAEVEKSVAVLPFVNMSSDPENEYFSDGITEEILNALATVDGLRVISRTSSFAFKGKNEDVREIGKKLQVGTVLEGSVRKAGTRVRITAQLINTSDGFHIWSEVYDRDLSDIFAVQDEIAHKITNQLRTKFSGAARDETLVKSATENIDAYNLYLKGLYYFHKWTPDDVHRALRCFEEAIELEPDFSLPHSGTSSCYIFLGATGHLQDAYQKAEHAAVIALKLDPNIVESHVAIAMVNMFYYWDLEASGRSFSSALEINPNSASVLHYYGMYLAAIKDYQRAFENLEKAVLLDPLSLPVNGFLGIAYRIGGRYEKAIKQFDKTLEIDPSFRMCLEGKAWTYYLKGDLDAALLTFKELQKQVNHPLKGITGLGFIYARRGDKTKAREYLDLVYKREASDENVLLDIDFALIYTGLGEYEKVFFHLRKAFENHHGHYFVFTDPVWEEMKQDPRFQQLRAMVKKNPD